jgi:hypothetical protein
LTAAASGGAAMVYRAVESADVEEK